MEYIYLHGFLSGPDSEKGRFLDRKFAGIQRSFHRPDLNGGDFEHMTITSQMEIIDRLIQSLPGELVLIGSSLGAYLSVLAASRWQQVKKVVLMAPAFDFVKRHFQRLSPEQLQIWKTSGYIKLYHYHHREQRKLSYQIVEDALKYQQTRLDVTIPILIFHGINDQSVPYQVSIDFLEEHPQARLMLMDSDHGLLDKMEVIWEYMSHFLQI